jgi:hypothetical protein
MGWSGSPWPALDAPAGPRAVMPDLIAQTVFARFPLRLALLFVRSFWPYMGVPFRL